MHVSSTEEYPNEWARLIASLVSRPGWSRARLAREAGINRNTPRRWMDGESANITSTMIRLIADATDTPLQVVAEAAVGARRQDLRNEDDARRSVIESDLPEDWKQEILDYIEERRVESEEALRRDIDMMLRARRGEGDAQAS